MAYSESILKMLNGDQSRDEIDTDEFDITPTETGVNFTVRGLKVDGPLTQTLLFHIDGKTIELLWNDTAHCWMSADGKYVVKHEEGA